MLARRIHVQVYLTISYPSCTYSVVYFKDAHGCWNCTT